MLQGELERSGGDSHMLLCSVVTFIYIYVSLVIFFHTSYNISRLSHFLCYMTLLILFSELFVPISKFTAKRT